MFNHLHLSYWKWQFSSIIYLLKLWFLRGIFRMAPLAADLLGAVEELIDLESLDEPRWLKQKLPLIDVNGYQLNPLRVSGLLGRKTLEKTLETWKQTSRGRPNHNVVNIFEGAAPSNFDSDSMRMGLVRPVSSSISWLWLWELILTCSVFPQLPVHGKKYLQLHRNMNANIYQ